MSEEAINQINNRLDETYHWIIDELRQENQQLKEDIKDLDNQKQMMFKNMQLNQLKVCELAKALDEIREYIETNVKEHVHDDYDVTLYYSLNQDECDDLLQILDKVKE